MTNNDTNTPNYTEIIADLYDDHGPAAIREMMLACSRTMAAHGENILDNVNDYGFSIDDNMALVAPADADADDLDIARDNIRTHVILNKSAMAIDAIMEIASRDLN